MFVFSSYFMLLLATQELVRMIMNVKRSFIYFNTSNIDRSLLPPELAGSLPDSEILLNEVLSTSDFTEYLSIKDTAKKLVFQFVRYCNGRILVRRKERERVHVVRTVADLGVIMASMGVSISGPSCINRMSQSSNMLPSSVAMRGNERTS